MRLGNYKVEVNGGQESQEGYVLFTLGNREEKATFTINVTNFGTTECDAEIKLNNSLVGVWRVGPGETYYITRPANNTGKFTVGFRDSVVGAKLGSHQIDREDSGVITVIFTPNKKDVPSIYSKGVDLEVAPLTRSLTKGSKGVDSAVIGLSGTSNQKFREVGPLSDPDYAKQVTINLRLVVSDASDADDDIRPITPLSNLVPPAI